MPDAVSNTSPLLYLHRIGLLNWLPILFATVRIPQAVLDEFEIGRNAGHDVPDLTLYDWLAYHHESCKHTHPVADPGVGAR